MKRIINQDNTKALDHRNEYLVETALTVLTIVHERFFKYPKGTENKHIHKQKKSPYYTSMLKVCEYLLELREDYTNPLEFLLEDYFEVGYRYFQEYGKAPSITSLSAGGGKTNCIRFEEWILQWELDNKPDEYWMVTKNEHLDEVKKEVKKEIHDRRKKKREAIGTNEHVSDIEIIIR